MEGRTIVRPGALLHREQAVTETASMEGRTIVRPGQLLTDADDDAERASMEGRTIVRPGDVTNNQLAGDHQLQWRAGQLSGQAAQAGGTGRHSLTASMEGRTIVRPGRRMRHTPRSADHRFNGGPDNCPARQSKGQDVSFSNEMLQWRAGQLSGQARVKLLGMPRTNLASMEGRTIVRPGGQVGYPQVAVRIASMEGRTIVRPGVPAHHEPVTQRRASMEGRTIVRPGRARRHPHGSEAVASMEGRTIVRPGRHDAQAAARRHARFNGGPDNCPARRRRVWLQPPSRSPRFNGGPDNCPARRSRGSRRRPRPTSASMEGRTIVRPGISADAV